MADDIGMPGLDLFQPGQQDRLQPRGVAGQIFVHDFVDAGQGRRAANRVARVRAGHRAGRKLVHDRCAANDRRERQRTADAFAAADEVGRHAVMLEGPELARAAKAGLHFVEDEHDVVASGTSRPSWRTYSTGAKSGPTPW